MGSFGGFYKGEKKKSKKDKGPKGTRSISMGSPTFTLPEIVGKKKKWE